MVQESYSASAPGSLMLFGEHAVLHHNKAIVAAIDKRITVKLHPRTNGEIIIRSDQFAEFRTLVTDLYNGADCDLNLSKQLHVCLDKNAYQYVLAAITVLKEHISTGFVLEISSTMSPTVGFGSSAAVVVAVLGALSKWLGFTSDKQQLFMLAKQAMLAVQGRGSGADLAASIYGGVLYYVQEPFLVTALPFSAPLVAVYSGSKQKTPIVLAAVDKASRKCPDIYEHIYNGITACVEQAVVAIQAEDWPLVGSLCSLQHGLLNALGVSNHILEELVWQLRAAGALGAKISGSGLGDCVIAVGEITDEFSISVEQKALGVKELPVQISVEGLLYE